MKLITQQEHNILDLICQGFTSRQIAEQLKISFHTVQNHRKNLRLKFRASNSVDLVLKVTKIHQSIESPNTHITDTSQFD